MQQRIAIWIPAGVCAYLSIPMMFSPETSGPAFYSFLPLCFFFAGRQQLAMHKRLKRLESQLPEELKEELRREQREQGSASPTQLIIGVVAVLAIWLIFSLQLF